MKNNYDREALLSEALFRNELSLKDLGQQLGMSAEEVVAGLNGPDQVKHISRVSEAMGVEMAYFWGGMRYDENGKLVNIEH